MSAAGRYLLDTNILSQLVRDPQGSIAEKIRTVGENAVFTSIIVASELRFGALKARSPRLQERVDTILDAIDVQAFDAPADLAYARLRQTLETLGTPIGPNDMLIAAQALAAEAVMVTANANEFSRVPGLAVENWLATEPG